MPDVPSSVIEAASWAAKVAARRGKRGLDQEQPRLPRHGIQVRRFAGPSAYTSALEHLRIAHLTDLHVGRVTPYAVQREAVTLTNEEEPDLVVITGDFVCHSQLYLDQLAEVIHGFHAPVVAVLGNHDYWSGAEEVARTLARAGAEVLRNRNTTITLRHERLQLVGLDDAYTGHASRDEAVKGLRADLPALALSHIAEEADALWHHGIPLVLSGHTHGGQVTLARLHELAVGMIGGHRYVHGLYGNRRQGRKAASLTRAEHGMTLEALPETTFEGGSHAGCQGAVYVGAGIGAAVVPLRLGERGKREITVFELGAEPGSFEEHHSEQVPLRGRVPSPAVKARRAAAVMKKRLSREKRSVPARNR